MEWNDVDEDRFQTKTTLLEVQLQIFGIRDDIKLVNDGRYFVYNRRCQMRRRMLGKKYKKIQIYLFNDLFIWVSERGKFKGSYSFYDPNLEVKKCGKENEAMFSIGMQNEKHPREIVCVDDCMCFIYLLCVWFICFYFFLLLHCLSRFFVSFSTGCFDVEHTCTYCSVWTFLHLFALFGLFVFLPLRQRFCTREVELSKNVFVWKDTKAATGFCVLNSK